MMLFAIFVVVGVAYICADEKPKKRKRYDR